MKKIVANNTKIFIALLITLFIVVSISFFIANMPRVNAIAYSDYIYMSNTVLRERRVHTINDDFADNRVIVTLRPSHSAINRSIDLSSFRTSNVISAECLTKYSTSQQNRNFTNSIIIDSAQDLTYLSNPSVITNRRDFSQILKIELREHCKENVLRVIYELEQLDKVLAAEPDLRVRAVNLSSNSTPNDPLFYRQWGLHGEYGINIENAWGITTGNTDPLIRVGLFESGIWAEHPDLQGRVIEGNLTPDPSNHEHGTNVAGVLGAIADNGEGIAGVAPVEMALLDAGHHDWGYNESNFVESLTWAIDNNIRIVNASFMFVVREWFLGNWRYRPADKNENHAAKIRNFGLSGGLFVAAAGNIDPRITPLDIWGNADSRAVYPAGYGDSRPHRFPEINNVISVGAHNINGGRWSDTLWREGSFWGQHSVHIYAPGQDIWTISYRHFYSSTVESGTSLAAPHVAGVAALLLSVNPNLTATQLRDAILNNAEPIRIYTTWGVGHYSRRLDAYAAVRAVYQTASWFDFNIIYGTNNVEISTRQNANLVGDVVIPSEVFIDGDIYQVTRIGANAFESQTNLTNITFPSIISYIGSRAFAYSGLTSFTIPQGSFPSIAGDAFVGTNFDWGTLLFRTVYHWNSNPAVLTGTNFWLTGNIILPRQINGVYITAVYGLEGNSCITSVYIPYTIQIIGNSAFRHLWRLTCVYFGLNAFGQSYLQEIGSFAFASTGIASVSIPPNVARICVGAFARTSYLASVQFTSGWNSLVISTGAFAFTNRLEYFFIPDRVTEIGDFAFEFSSLRIFEFADNGRQSQLRRIGHGAFSGTRITNIIIPDQVISVGYNAFGSGLGLESLHIGSGLTSLWQGAQDIINPNLRVYWNYNPALYLGAFRQFLRRVYVPWDITNIPAYAFAGAVNLQRVYIERKASDGVIVLGASAFLGVPWAMLVVLPSWSCVDIYRSSAGWVWQRITSNAPQMTPQYWLPSGLTAYAGQRLYHINLNPDFFVNGSWQWVSPDTFVCSFAGESLKPLSMWIGTVETRWHHARFVPLDTERFYVVYRLVPVAVMFGFTLPPQPRLLFGGTLANSASSSSFLVPADINILLVNQIRIVVSGSYNFNQTITLPNILATSEFLLDSKGCTIQVSFALSPNRAGSVIIRSHQRVWSANVRIYAMPYDDPQDPQGPQGTLLFDRTLYEPIHLFQSLRFPIPGHASNFYSNSLYINITGALEFSDIVNFAYCCCWVSTDIIWLESDITIQVTFNNWTGEIWINVPPHLLPHLLPMHVQIWLLWEIDDSTPKTVIYCDFDVPWCCCLGHNVSFYVPEIAPVTMYIKVYYSNIGVLGINRIVIFPGTQNQTFTFVGFNYWHGQNIYIYYILNFNVCCCSRQIIISPLPYLGFFFALHVRAYQ